MEHPYFVYQKQIKNLLQSKGISKYGNVNSGYLKAIFSSLSIFIPFVALTCKSSFFFQDIKDQCLSTSTYFALVSNTCCICYIGMMSKLLIQNAWRSVIFLLFEYVLGLLTIFTLLDNWKRKLKTCVNVYFINKWAYELDFFCSETREKNAC